MKPNRAVVLAISIALGALPVTTDGSWGRGGGGHGGGGHGGGGHFGGGHGGGGHFGGGHFGGGHFGGGHFAGHGHFGGGHFEAEHYAGHFGGGHFGGRFDGGRLGARERFAGGHRFAGHFNRNAFGTRGGWHRFAAVGRAGRWGSRWGGGWGGRGGWVGPVFWPFLLGDVFSYALWPSASYDPFWSYGTALTYDYDPYVPAYGSGDLSNIYGYAGSGQYASRANETPPDVTQSCGGFAPGVTSFPIQQIRQAIHPTGDQITLVEDLADASSKASATISASCPSEPPLTSPARLDAVQRRLEATMQAIEIVRPALANLYNSLSDEQRQRLEAIGAEEATQQRGTAVTGASGGTTVASLCVDQAASFTKLPLQRIDEIVKPTGQQQSVLDQLKQVSEHAADNLRASCPTQPPETPMARLNAMNSRLAAMVQAIKTIRPVLGSFYTSLSDEQKAQFNAMGQQNRSDGRPG